MAARPTRSEMIDAVADVTRAAVRELFAQHPGSYYYLTLFSSGDVAAGEHLEYADGLNAALSW